MRKKITRVRLFSSSVEVCFKILPKSIYSMPSEIDPSPVSPKRQISNVNERSASAYSFKSPQKSPASTRPSTGGGAIRRIK